MSNINKERSFEAIEKAGQSPWDKRWVLIDPETKGIIDDAQGYGYKSKQKAIKAGWYKFSGGKEKKQSAKSAAKNFWKKNKEFAKEVNNLYEWGFKEIARGEIDPDEEIDELIQKMGVVGFKKEFVDYME